MDDEKEPTGSSVWDGTEIDFSFWADASAVSAAEAASCLTTFSVACSVKDAGGAGEERVENEAPMSSKRGSPCRTGERNRRMRMVVVGGTWGTHFFPRLTDI